jgi:hypothetical protein
MPDRHMLCACASTACSDEAVGKPCGHFAAMGGRDASAVSTGCAGPRSGIGRATGKNFGTSSALGGTSAATSGASTVGSAITSSGGISGGAAALTTLTAGDAVGGMPSNQIPPPTKTARALKAPTLRQRERHKRCLWAGTRTLWVPNVRLPNALAGWAAEPTRAACRSRSRSI